MPHPHPLGDPEHTLAGYVRARRFAEAAQLAAQLDRSAEAARLYLEAQLPYEAAVCFQKAQDLPSCLEALLRVPAASPRYRTACVHAIRVALTLGEPLARLSTFLVSFLSSRPASRAEAAALGHLAASFARDQKLRIARSIYRSVLSAFPDDADAREGLAALPPDEPARPVSLVTPQPLPAVRRPTTAAAPVRRTSKLGELLVSRGKLSAEQLERALKRPEALGSDLVLGEVLTADGLVEEIDVVRALSELAGIACLEDAELLARATPELAARLGVDQAERWHVVPVALMDKHLHVAMQDPRDFAVLDQLRFAAGVSQVLGLFATPLGIRKAIRKLYYGEVVETAGEGWSGNLGGFNDGALAPFSDRFTGTREHAFDTSELAERAAQVAEPRRMEPTVQHAPEPAPVDAQPAVGEVFAGRYRLEARLGSGGSAVVFRARDLELDEAVAVKLFHPSVQSEVLIARFKLELSLARQLAHPNVIRVFDLGNAAGWRYLTMELLEGEDLSKRLERVGAVPLREGLAYLEQVCAGLQAAHERGIVHRDIKPQNLFITTSGAVKVMDFGIAKRVQAAAGVTLDGMLAGTPDFMSPEQINGFSKVTHLTDLYALGATAYALFTGQPPFFSTKVSELLLAQLHQLPLPPRERNPLIPAELDAVILRLLEKDPARRFQSCATVGEALARIRARL